MKIAILTSGILPVPAVQGGAVENLIDFYLNYNNQHKKHDITVFSVYHKDVENHPSLSSDVNHYVFIDVSSSWARIKRKIYQFTHKKEYYNYFIEFFFEQCYTIICNEKYDTILLENRPGYAYKLAMRGFTNVQLHLHNDLLNSTTPFAHEILLSLTNIITVSEYIKGCVTTIAQTNKIQTIYNGINLESFSKSKCKQIDRDVIGLKKDDFVIIYSGRINQEKGIAELVNSMIKLKKYTKIKLLVIGSSFFGDSIDDNLFISNLKKKTSIISGNVLFTGFIPYSEMPNYLNMGDIVVVPSIWDDPFPTTVLEAQAMGLPLIVTERGGIPEEVKKDNAIIIPTDDNMETLLCEAILSLYKDPEKRKKMGRKSLENSRYYNKERFSKEILEAISGNELTSLF